MVLPIAAPNSDKLPIIDLSTHETLLWVDDHQARELIRDRKVIILHAGKGAKRHVRGLGWLDTSAAAPQRPASIRKGGGMGDSHRQERVCHCKQCREEGHTIKLHEKRDDNAAGVWSIDRIPRSMAPIFRQVQFDCLTRFPDTLAA